MTAPAPVTIRAAAAALGTTERVLRLAIARGAPVAQRGRRGRGNSTLVDVDALLAWRGAGALSERQATLLRRGAAIEAVDAVLADALHAAFVDKSLETYELKPWQAACVLEAVWFVAAQAIHDHLEREGCGLPPLIRPRKIDRLRQF